MAVEKMKLINIIGPIAEFDRIVMDYVIENDIHLEDMLYVLANAQDVFPFTEANPYVRLFQKSTKLCQLRVLIPRPRLKETIQ